MLPAVRLMPTNVQKLQNYANVYIFRRILITLNARKIQIPRSYGFFSTRQKRTDAISISVLNLFINMSHTPKFTHMHSTYVAENVRLCFSSTNMLYLSYQSALNEHRTSKFQSKYIQYTLLNCPKCLLLAILIFIRLVPTTYVQYFAPLDYWCKPFA